MHKYSQSSLLQSNDKDSNIHGGVEQEEDQSGSEFGSGAESE
jgi:hypothetical protein